MLANDSVDFDVQTGEIHALLGENAAGRSTLMKILFGLYAPDRGEILLNGERSRVRSPASAIAAGIGMIHQHFMLVPTLTVTENMALGLPSKRKGRPDLACVRARVAELSEAYGLDMNPDAHLWQLAVGERQRVEIIKALLREARLLVLDEPTAVLTPGEVDDLFVTLRRMANDGRGLVFISHKLHEVLALADRITVLRDGSVVGTTVPADTDREGLAHMMVGRPVKLAPDMADTPDRGVRLSIRGFTVEGDRGTAAVQELDLDVRGGRIVGIAGVSGNGQRELAEAISGLRPITSGTVAIDGTDVTGADPKQVRNAGLAFVPEERMRDGAIGSFTVAENPMLLAHAEPEFSRRGVLRTNAIRSHGESLVKEYAVRTPDLTTATSSLSGGQHPKAHPGTRTGRRASSPAGRSADPRCGHRRRGVHTRAPGRPARAGHRHPGHLRGPRRSHGPLRRGGGDVRGKDRGRRTPQRVHRERAGAADGRRRGRDGGLNKARPGGLSADLAV